MDVQAPFAWRDMQPISHHVHSLEKSVYRRYRVCLLDAQISHAQSAQKNHDHSSPVERAHINIDATDKPIATTDAQHAVEETFIEYSGGSDIKRIKIGCIGFFAALALLFIFLLFVLPYLLD